MSHYVIGDLHLAFSVNKPKDILVVFGIFLKGLNKMKIINLVEDTKGNSVCEYEHGLSFYVETKKHKILVDTGATDMFMRNAQVLNVDLEQIDVVVLSHGHYDHAGGIMSFSKLNKKAGEKAEKGELLAELFYNDAKRLDEAIEHLKSAYVISESAVQAEKLIYKTIV